MIKLVIISYVMAKKYYLCILECDCNDNTRLIFYISHY